MAKESSSGTLMTVAAVGAGIYFAWPWLQTHLFGAAAPVPKPGGPAPAPAPVCGPNEYFDAASNSCRTFPPLVSNPIVGQPITFTPAPTPPAAAKPPAPQSCSFICPDGSTLTFDASLVGGCDKLVGLTADQLAALLGPSAPSCPKAAPAPPATPPPGSPTSAVTAIALALTQAADQNSTPGPLTVWGWNYLYNTINPNTYWGSLGTGDADLPQYADGSLIDALTYATARAAAGYGLSGYSPSSRNGWLYSRRGANRTNYVRRRIAI
jgi:hypothetical protein